MSLVAKDEKMVPNRPKFTIRDSIVASIPACHAGDRGSIPRRGVTTFLSAFLTVKIIFVSAL